MLYEFSHTQLLTRLQEEEEAESPVKTEEEPYGPAVALVAVAVL